MAEFFTSDQVKELCADIAEREEITVEFNILGNKDMVNKDLKLGAQGGRKSNSSPGVCSNTNPTVNTVAILVDEEGRPVTALQEGEEIQESDLVNADGAFVAHFPALKQKTAMPKNVPQGPNIKPLKDILLNYMNVSMRDKLMKRMPTHLIKLKTRDFKTAKAFIQSEQYADVRKSIAKQLEKYVTKDLGMKIAR